jgi:hypothetical protein
VAGQASTIPHALHSNLGLVAEHGRASLAPHHYRTATPRHVRQRAGTGGGAIDEYVVHHNINPKPFIWIKSVRDILQKVICANSRLNPKHRVQHSTNRQHCKVLHQPNQTTTVRRWRGPGMKVSSQSATAVLSKKWLAIDDPVS